MGNEAERYSFIRSRVEYPRTRLSAGELQGESLNLQKMAGLRPGSTINFLTNDDTPPFRAGRVIQHKSGLTAKAFAESLGLSKAMGYQISRGLLKPSRAVLEKLSQSYHVNLHWFLTGKGPSGLDSDTVGLSYWSSKPPPGTA
jgi:hypothetical protein